MKAKRKKYLPKRRQESDSDDISFASPPMSEEQQLENRKAFGKAVSRAKAKTPVTHWNYRIMAVPNPIDEEIYFRFHEVHYTNGVPDGYTKEPVHVGGENIQDISYQLNKMKEALQEPIYWYGDKWPELYQSK